MCAFCNMRLCVRLDFVMCDRVYVGFVMCASVCVSFVMCVGFCNV